MRGLLSDRRRALPLILTLLLATMVGQGIAVGSRIAGDRDRPDVRGPDPEPLAEGISSDDARARLCARPGYDPGEPQQGDAALPPPLQAVADDVQALRGLDFTGPVHPEGIGREEIARRIRASINASFPPQRMDRRTLAWRAMGVIAPDASLANQIREYSESEIIGFFDTITKELVFAGSAADPSPYERVTLAHELTHALDDQHYDLSRLDDLDIACDDDALLAGISVAEGSARYIEFLYVTQRMTDAEVEQYQVESFERAGPVPDLSPFFRDLLVFPYPYGQQFVQVKQDEGGQEAVDAALETLPRSTEQIIHPERFPKDEPQDVDVRDMAPALGEGWTDLDVFDAGEAFIRTALALRVGELRSAEAAAGWDGGEYRAWRSGKKVAVAMETVWDTARDATQFVRTMHDWLGRTRSGATSRIVRDERRVWVLWGPDRAASDAMAEALTRESTAT